MELAEIKEAVLAGKTVHWSNEGYVVTHHNGRFGIKFIPSGHYIGLTWADGVTMNGREEDFYLAGDV